MIKISKKSPFDPAVNPFTQDLLNMGTTLGKNVLAMKRNHDDENCEYVILLNRTTGERIKVEFDSLDVGIVFTEEGDP